MSENWAIADFDRKGRKNAHIWADCQYVCALLNALFLSTFALQCSSPWVETPMAPHVNSPSPSRVRSMTAAPPRAEMTAIAGVQQQRIMTRTKPMASALKPVSGGFFIWMFCGSFFFLLDCEALTARMGVILSREVSFDFFPVLDMVCEKHVKVF